MSKEITSFLHALALVVQVLNAMGKLAPPEWQVWVALVVGAIQGILGVAAHYWNPDGTPASVAFNPQQ